MGAYIMPVRATNWKSTIYQKVISAPFSFLACLEVARLFRLGVTSKKNSIFTDIVQIDGDPPPSYPIFDKFIFDKVLTMLTSLPPLEFLTKIMKF